MGRLELEVGNDLAGMNSREYWAGMKDFPGSRQEYGGRFCWLERLYVAYEVSVCLGISREGPGRKLEII